MRRNSTNLVDIFGPQAMKSCVILLTKTSPSAEKLAARQSACSSLGSYSCPHVLWKSNHIDDVSKNWVNLSNAELKKQKDELFGVLRTLPKFHMSNLQQKKDEIMKEAAKLRDQTPVQYETVSIEIDVPYQEPEVIKVTKQRPVVKDKWNGEMGRWFGIKKNYVVWENYQEDQTIYHSKVRKETRQNSVALPKPPIDNFIPIAKKKIMENFKASLQ